ncbi:DMP19 family protein [Chitinophagaceae bacterium MMS25-I14]
MKFKSKYLPQIPPEKITEKKLAGNDHEYMELLTEPLHAELYRRQTFDFMEELSEGQRLLISYDYVRTQVLQGGFIQFIQNGYISLLLPMPAWLQPLGADDMAQLLDDVLKVYVLNIEKLERETTVDEFARLYTEMPEFEQLDERFTRLDDATVSAIMAYASMHLEEFVAF